MQLMGELSQRNVNQLSSKERSCNRSKGHNSHDNIPANMGNEHPNVKGWS